MFRSPTINNTSSPAWEHKVQFEVGRLSPRQLCVEIFDDDIGKDSPIGNITLDTSAIIRSSAVERTVKLDNCKSGELVYSAFFEPSSDQEATLTTTTATTTATAGGGHAEIDLVDPLYIDKEFVVVKSDNIRNWFMVR